MTAEKIVIAIAQKLNSVFGDEYEIYTDAVEQDLSEPCFFILQMDESLDHVMGGRYLSAQAYDIHYFPKEHSHSEISSVSERLFGAMEYITTGEGLLRGTGLKCKTTGYVLHFFVDYNFFTFRPSEEQDPMSSMQKEVKLKG